MILKFIEQLEEIKSKCNKYEWDSTRMNSDQIKKEFKNRFKDQIRRHGSYIHQLNGLPDFIYNLEGRPIRQLTSEILNELTISQFTYFADSFESIENLEALDLSNNQLLKIRNIILQ